MGVNFTIVASFTTVNTTLGAFVVNFVFLFFF